MWRRFNRRCDKITKMPLGDKRLIYTFTLFGLNRTSVVPSDQTDLAAPFIAPAPVFFCVCLCRALLLGWTGQEKSTLIQYSLVCSGLITSDDKRVKKREGNKKINAPLYVIGIYV